MADDISAVTPAVAEMKKNWDIVTALLGGTLAMREAGEEHLPRWPQEEGEAYERRKNSATLFPAYHRTVQTLTGKPFSKPIAIGEKVPEAIKTWLDDVDLQGRNLDAFASSLMEKTLGYGLGGILVECPPRPGDVVTRAQEESIGLRPYFVQVHATQVLGWRSQYTPGKGWTLTQLRIMEEVEVEDGPYGIKCVAQVRLLEPGKWSTHRKVDAASDEWAMFQDGTTSLNYIPFVPTYGQRIGFMMGVPPLIELAHMNIKHWQSQSDQDTIVHVARVPILVATGVSDDNFAVVVGASTCVKLTDENADLKFVEHTGKAIEAGETSLKTLKDEMRQAGAELLVIGQRVEVTATQVASENELGTCALQRISQGEEDALDQALQMMADYAKLGDGGNVTLFNDFGIASLSDASAELLFKMATSGKISDESFHEEMQRRNIVSPDLSWEEEKERLDAEGPPPGMVGLDPLTGLPLPPAPPGPPKKPKKGEPAVPPTVR